MVFTERVTDTLGRLHAAYRTLAIARQVQQRQRFDGLLVEDIVTALVRQVSDVETELAALVDAAGGTITSDGYALSAGVNDRRARMRPKFVLHKMADAPVGRRALVPA
jgi:hypothetical protein